MQMTCFDKNLPSLAPELSEHTPELYMKGDTTNMYLIYLRDPHSCELYIFYTYKKVSYARNLSPLLQNFWLP
jgi:hypothetical protein